MRASIYVIIIILCLACNNVVEKQVYENQKYKIELTEKCGKCVRFELTNKETGMVYSGCPVLDIEYITNIGERGLEYDSIDTTLSQSGLLPPGYFQCDSTYIYENKKFSISFAKEIKSRYRLSVILGSSGTDWEEYTILYHVDPSDKGQPCVEEDRKSVHAADGILVRKIYGSVAAQMTSGQATVLSGEERTPRIHKITEYGL